MGFPSRPSFSSRRRRTAKRSATGSSRKSAAWCCDWSRARSWRWGRSGRANGGGRRRPGSFSEKDGSKGDRGKRPHLALVVYPGAEAGRQPGPVDDGEPVRSGGGRGGRRGDRVLPTAGDGGESPGGGGGDEVGRLAGGNRPQAGLGAGQPGRAHA